MVHIEIVLALIFFVLVAAIKAMTGNPQRGRKKRRDRFEDLEWPWRPHRRGTILGSMSYRGIQYAKDKDAFLKAPIDSD